MRNIVSFSTITLTLATAWLFKQIFALFERDENLMSKEAIELLSNPETRNDFIDFTSGKEDAADSSDIETKSRKKTFELKNGEKITIVTYS
jgi:hypothetical protein